MYINKKIVKLNSCLPWYLLHKVRLEATTKAIQRRAARFVCKDFRRKSSVSSMISKLGWKSLEERRAISRLTLLYKSVHYIAAINTDQLQTKQARGISTRKTSTISFNHPSFNKQCFQYPFLPRTTVEWNLLPSTTSDSATVDTFKSKIKDVEMSTFLRGAHF